MPDAGAGIAWALPLGLAAASVQLLFLALVVWHDRVIRARERSACFRAFANNVWVGFAMFAGVVLETYAGAELALWLEGLEGPLT